MLFVWVISVAVTLLAILNAALSEGVFGVIGVSLGEGVICTFLRRRACAWRSTRRSRFLSAARCLQSGLITKRRFSGCERAKKVLRAD